MDWHAYFDRVRDGRCTAACVTVPPPLVPSPLHDFLDRVRDGRCSTICTTPPTEPLFDFIPSIPAAGGDFNPNDPTESFIQDWLFAGGADAGGVLLGRACNVVDFYCRIEAGQNSTDDATRFIVTKNGVDTTIVLTVLDGQVGWISAVGAPVAFTATDRLNVRWESDAASGLISGIRFGFGIQDAA